MSELTVLKYCIPFNQPIHLKGITLTKREGFLLKFNDQYGEAAPLPGFSLESLKDAEEEIKQIQKLIGSGILEISNAKAEMPSVNFALTMLNNTLANFERQTPYRTFFVAPDDADKEIPILFEQLKTADNPTVKIKAGIFSETFELDLIQKLKDKSQELLKKELKIIIDGNARLSLDKVSSYIKKADKALLYFEEPTDDVNGNINLGVNIGVDEHMLLLSDALLNNKSSNQVAEAYLEGRISPVLKPTLFYDFRKYLVKGAVISSCFESPIGISWLERLAKKHSFQAGTDTLKYFPEDARNIESFLEKYIVDSF